MTIKCQCGGNLEFDLEETRKDKITAIYACECGKMYRLQPCGEKEQGWKTKKLLERNKLLKNIPY